MKRLTNPIGAFNLFGKDIRGTAHKSVSKEWDSKANGTAHCITEVKNHSAVVGNLPGFERPKVGNVIVIQ